MWSDRKQDKSVSRPGLSHERETVSESVTAVSSLAVIGRAMVIRGQIRSKEGLYIDGQVDGTIELPDCRLTIGPHGKVGADARAREIEVLGSVVGDLQAAKKIIIRKGGRLVGDLRTPGIVIEEGAYFKGKIEIVSESEAKPAAAQSSMQKTAARA